MSQIENESTKGAPLLENIDQGISHSGIDLSKILLNQASDLEIFGYQRNRALVSNLSPRGLTYLSWSASMPAQLSGLTAAYQEGMPLPFSVDPQSPVYRSGHDGSLALEKLHVGDMQLRCWRIQGSDQQPDTLAYGFVDVMIMAPWNQEVAKVFENLAENKMPLLYTDDFSRRDQNVFTFSLEQLAQATHLRPFLHDSLQKVITVLLNNVPHQDYSKIEIGILEPGSYEHQMAVLYSIALKGLGATSNESGLSGCNFADGKNGEKVALFHVSDDSRIAPHLDLRCVENPIRGIFETPYKQWVEKKQLEDGNCGSQSVFNGELDWLRLIGEHHYDVPSIDDLISWASRAQIGMAGGS